MSKTQDKDRWLAVGREWLGTMLIRLGAWVRGDVEAIKYVPTRAYSQAWRWN